MKNVFTIIVLFLLVCSSAGQAESNWLNFSHTNGVTAIQRTGDYWWLGTDGGLVQFNETNNFLKVYNRGNSNIPTNHIRQLAKDENGNIWIGTEYGMSKFDGATFTNFNTDDSQILSNRINLLVYEINKGVWVVTDSALTFFDGTTWTHYRQDDQGNDLSDISALFAASPYGLLFTVGNTVEFLNHAGSFGDMQFTGSGNISGVGYDYLNNIYVSTYDNGYWNNVNNVWTNYTPSNTPIPAYRIDELKFAPDGDIYFNHGQNGVSILHIDGTWNLIPDQDGDEKNYLTTIYAGDKIGLGLGWPYIGFVVAEHPEEWTYNFSEVYNTNKSPIHSNETQSIVIKNGLKYIGSRGIDILDNTNKNIKRYDLNSGDFSSLFNPTTYLEVDASGNIWCADNLNSSLTKISGDKISLLNADSLGTGYSNVTGLQWETNRKPNGEIYGTMWVSLDGSGYSGIAYYDSLWHFFPNEHPQYPWSFRQFVRDESGIMWFAGYGINSYNGISFTSYWDTAPLKIATCVVKDSSGVLWFGGKPDGSLGEAGGLVKYDGETWTKYTSGNSALPNNWVTSLAVDTLGNVWAGTYGGGMVKIDGAMNMTVFTRDNSPLDNNNIAKVAVDPETNNLWVLNSGSGVFVFNEQTTFTSIDKKGKNIPKSFVLYQNFPNPFNPTTKIRFVLPKASHVTLKIFDVSGREISTLVNGNKTAGQFDVNFDGSTLANGFYFYQLKSGAVIQTRKMLLNK